MTDSTAPRLPRTPRPASTAPGPTRRGVLKMGGALAAAVPAASILAACAPGGVSAPSPDSGATGTIDFWDMEWGTASYISTAQALVKKFNASQKGITVRYRSIPWNNWYQTFSTAIASGTAPDISTGASYQSLQFYDSGAILPIDDVVSEMKSDGTLTDFKSGTVAALKYKCHYVALPWALDVRLVYYRSDQFAQAGLKPPTTWAELMTAATKLSRNGKYAFATASDNTDMLLSLLINNGGGLFTPAEKLDTLYARNVEAMNYYSALIKQKLVDPASGSYQGTDFLKPYSRGDASILITGPSNIPSLPANVASKMALMKPVAGPHGNLGTAYWINNIMIYKQSKHPEAAKKFLTWWSKNQLPLWTQGQLGQYPARTSLASAPHLTSNPITRQALSEWLPVAKTTAARGTTLFPQLNAVEGDGTLYTLQQNLLQGTAPSSALSTAQKGLTQSMKSA